MYLNSKTKSEWLLRVEINSWRSHVTRSWCMTCYSHTIRIIMSKKNANWIVYHLYFVDIFIILLIIFYHSAYDIELLTLRLRNTVRTRVTLKLPSSTCFPQLLYESLTVWKCTKYVCIFLRQVSCGWPLL